jgi:outer membrane protein TolC
MKIFPLALLCAAPMLASLTGCAGFSRDGGFTPVAASARSAFDAELRWPRNGEEVERCRQTVRALLERPLSPADAVQVALLNNAGLRADFADLAISEADLVQAGRLPNPRFDLRHAAGGGAYDVEETLSFNVLALLTLPYAHAQEARRFKAAQQALSERVANLATATRTAYFEALAARESLQEFERVDAAAAAGATLAARMQQAGNWNSLDAAREQLFQTEAARDLKRAGAREVAARERLTRLLGLALDGSEPPLTLAQTLPALPAEIPAPGEVEQSVLDQRLDLKRGRLELDALARQLKLTRATRFVNVLEAGATRVKQGSADEGYEHGYTVSVEIPLFDGGGPRMRTAEARYAKAADRFAQSVIAARSQIREADALFRLSYEVARQQRDEALPLHKAIAEQDLKRYNASLASVFDLLADAREQSLAVSGYIDSLRDFWIAKSHLDAALVGGSES